MRGYISPKWTGVMGTRKSLPRLKTGILRFLPLSFFTFCFVYSIKFLSSKENKDLIFS